ncbi:MAG TPA: hypothetical protein ENI64_06945 [Gammaproteobacteria bacterium]|nr:hypothetical protein [Gammaproteobacteria bacterium]
MKITSATLFKGIQLPCWARWVAQDADGRWWVYEHEVGQITLLKQDSPPDNWRACLLRADGTE